MLQPELFISPYLYRFLRLSEIPMSDREQRRIEAVNSVCKENIATSGQKLGSDGLSGQLT